jgi:hypothetical protein
LQEVGGVTELTEEQRVAVGRAIEAVVLNGAPIVVCPWLVGDVLFVTTGEPARVFCSRAAEVPFRKFVESMRKELWALREWPGR